MKTIVDVVNFNPDASCLASEKWLNSLKDGKNSTFYKWLSLYVKLEKKMVLGLTGAAVADLAACNPESIELINANPDIFEMILRPFSHDIALLRVKDGFRRNLEAGHKTILKEFKNVANYYLPPEFMLMNEHVKILNDLNVEGTFINHVRFKDEIKKRLPDFPYVISGIFDSTLKCIPFEGELTASYLDSIHNYSAGIWNEHIQSLKNSLYFTWRDGESSFLIPDGLERERAWLQGEAPAIKRSDLNGTLNKIKFRHDAEIKAGYYFHYPIHSFNSWVKEFRMMGFINRLQNIELQNLNFSETEKALWLMTINSDILSSVEKDSPVIKLKNSAGCDDFFEFTIWRSERGVEGEEYLSLLENAINNINITGRVKNNNSPSMKKLKNRLDYLTENKV